MKENFETEFSTWSVEEQETIADCLEIVKPIYEGISNSDSDAGYEAAEKINTLYNSMTDQGYTPKDYYLWSLLAPNNAKDQDYVQFDAIDPADINGPGLIERFIKNDLASIKAIEQSSDEELEEAA